ncbi:hypothetical protein J1N35_041483 [Gossypium stocksii]|uniref:Uncharacterized protein n=1 Tax=Gossypium stocksii TaxID=47602 RepID=A0A9D3UFY7_9ROSI|nr:hypothetical protein J1N35_041483 [Gossypium stocksii]
MAERAINVGKVILKEIHDCARKKTEIGYFSSLITSLCLRVHVKTKTNSKGPYVQGYITAHGFERFHELNLTELSEPTKPETDESSNKFETEANSITETKK